MPKSLRLYCLSLGCTIASIALAIMGDRAAFHERNAEKWETALKENAKKVGDGASAVGD
jgi:hypothetical protein